MNDGTPTVILAYFNQDWTEEHSSANEVKLRLAL
jgi:hypothetical protein